MKQDGFFSGIIMMLLLLAAFSFTAFRYFAIALSTGIMDLGYLAVIWVILIVAVRLNVLAAYAVASLCGVLLTFPLSLFVSASQQGHFELADGTAFAEMTHRPIVVLWILEYVAATVIAQFAARFLWRGLNGVQTT